MPIDTDELPGIVASRAHDDPPTPTDIHTLAADYVGAHREHKARVAIYDAIVDGRWNTVWPDGSATQDMPKVAEYVSGDTEDLAGLVAGPEPSVIVPQDSDSPKDLTAAVTRQQILYTYRRLNKLKRLRRKTAIDLVSTGLSCWVVWPDYNSYFPRIVRKDPRIVYPDPALDDPAELSSLAVRYMTKARIILSQYTHLIPELYTNAEIQRGEWRGSNENLEIIEFYDRDWCIKLLHRGAKDARYRNRTIQLAAIRNFASNPLALIAYRESADGRFRGQFDKAIPVLGTANKLMELHLAQQADMIFAEKIIRGQFDNPEDIGPGANLYTMDYQANIERAETASSSQQLYQDVQLLLDQSREAAGIPQGRHGAVDQNIISAQGINALMGKYATAVTGYQETIGDLEQRANSLALEIDEKYLDASDKMLSGIAGGRSFSGEYTPSEDIAGEYENRVTYPAGSAMDSYNRTAQAVQQTQYRIISRRKAMELSDTVEDVPAMEAEIFKEALMDGLLTSLADPATDLLTRLEPLADLLKGSTPEEVALALRDKVAAQAEQQAAAGAAEAELLGATAAAPAAAVEQGPALPALPGRNY